MKEKYIIINSNININEDNVYIILKDYNKVIKDIKDSYKNKKDKIYEQFIKDYNRCKIYINKKREINNKTFINYFEILCDIYNYDLYDLYVICTQAIMGYCLEILHKNIPDNIYIGELEKKESLYYNIKCIDDKIIINIKKVLRLFVITELGEAKTLRKLIIKLYIPMYNKENIILSYKII